MSLNTPHHLSILNATDVQIRKVLIAQAIHRSSLATLVLKISAMFLTRVFTNTTNLIRYSVFIFFAVIFWTPTKAQDISGPGGYQVRYIGWNAVGDFTRSLILLHEAYNGTLMPFNLTVGTITGFRGDQSASLRTSIAHINTSTAYNRTSGSIQSISGDEPWKLKTCIYNGKKYIAVDIPFAAAFHSNGFQFAGWTSSSGENLKIVNYEIGGQPVNQNLISYIQDFVPDLIDTHYASQINLMSNVNIGTNQMLPQYQLQVKGKIRAQDVMVENQNWPDYVFSKDYSALSLSQIDKFIQVNHHLPEIPSASEVREKGIDLGDMNAKLLQKIEELTLHLIELNKTVQKQQLQIKRLNIKYKFGNR